MAATAEDARRSSMEKASKETFAFERLPDEIIEHILKLTTPNAFASLILLNRKWRMVSQQAHLYAQHLSRCPSYSATHREIPDSHDESSLPQLRRLFAREIKCNLFEAYLRPRETIINLVSTSISSSSAPGGEAFHFSLSPRGHYVLAYSSSRIHVLDVSGPEVIVKRELKILRRPASTTITDDGALLAVLSTDLQVDLYDLTGEHPKHSKAVQLDYTPRTISLSPKGSVLAAAYDSGVEVSSLDPDSIRAERRAVKCYAADSLSFSKDGTQLLGTTLQSRNPSTVVLTAPYYDPGNLPEESVSALWTTSILFPNGSRDCSHAVLLPSPTSNEASWTFTYDRVFETFRAVRIDDLRNGTTYFTGPVPDSFSKLLPSTLPTASEAGELVSAGFQGSIWLYGVPEDLEALPNTNGANSNVESGSSTPSTLPGRRNSAPSLQPLGRPQMAPRIPQWQLLCDRSRNTFVEGRKISSLDRVSAMAWVNDTSKSFHEERLVAVAPGVAGQPQDMQDDGMNPVDGGRMSILDFDYSVNDGGKRFITIEVGAIEPEVLEEEHRDLDTEVALVRRRTVAQRRRKSGGVSRSATSGARPIRTAIPPMPDIRDLPGGSETPPLARRFSIASIPTDRSETASIDEEREALDAPYSHTSPRSGTTLRRAATAAATNRRYYPRALVEVQMEYRRADGRNEHPHESDADNWVPPPPPYTRDPVPPLPEHIQRSLLAEAAAATSQRSNTQRASNLEFLGLDGPSLQRSHTVASVSSVGSRREQFSFSRTRSGSTTRSGGVSTSEGQRPATSYIPPVSPDFDDLYDISPPGSPGPTTRVAPPTPPTPASGPPSPPTPVSPLLSPSELDLEHDVSPLTPLPPPPTHQIPRRPVPSSVSYPARTSSMPPNTNPTNQQARLTPQQMPNTLDRQSTIPEAIGGINEGSPPATRPEPPAINNARERADQEVASRPFESHRISDLHLDTLAPEHYQDQVLSPPAQVSRRSMAESFARPPPTSRGEATAAWKRNTTAPISSQAASIPSHSSTPPRMVMPSPDQLARLNSRTGRPTGATDPRRASASFKQPPRLSSSNRFSWVADQDQSSLSTLEQGRSPPPRAAAGAHGRSSPSSRPNTTYLPRTRQSTLDPVPLRRLSFNSPPPTNFQYQQSMQRLDTIHSRSSAGEPSPWMFPRPTHVGVSRQSSRAERSAAKNIKDAKKKGWRATMRKEVAWKSKPKRPDPVPVPDSSWMDVSRDERPRKQSGKEKGGTKCVVM